MNQDRTLSAVPPSEDRHPDAAFLSAAGVAKTYRRGIWPRRSEREVLTAASIELEPGEVVGLVGENGSGKSTFMKILVGSLDRDSGRVIRRGTIGYCPQEPILYERLTADEHFALFGRGYGMVPHEVEVAAGEIFRLLDFEEYRSSRVEELSGGTRAKLNLGLALLPDPDVLLLDEPYAGFDWDTYQRFWTLAHRRRDSGRAVLIVSHFVADRDRFDRIVRLRDGRTGTW